MRDKIFSVPAADFDFIYGMALDNTTGTLYFTQSALNQYNPANPGAVPLDQVSGVFSFDVSNINTTSTAGLTLRPESSMKLVAYLPRIVNGPNHGGLGVLYGVAVDSIHHKVYFIDDSMGSSKAEFAGNPWDTPTNNIYVADIAGTPSVATSILQLATGPKNGQVIPPGYTQGFLNGITIDPNSQTLYFTTWDAGDNGVVGGSAVDNVYKAVVPAAGQQITLPAPLYTFASVGKPYDVEVNPGTGDLYIFNHNTVITSGSPTLAEEGAIVRGNVNGGAVTTIFTPALSGFPSPQLEGIALDMAPVLTLTGSGTPTYTEQGTAALPLAGSLHVTATDDGSALAGATITLGNSLSGDTLSISGTLPTGITIDAVHSTATSLVLMGIANLASYEAAFEQVAFSSTSDNPTNYGANTSRTVSFTVTDGVSTSNAVSTTLNVAAVNDAPVNHAPNAITPHESTSFAITGLSVSDVDADPANDAIQVALSVADGNLSVLAGVTNGLAANQIAGSGTGTVTLTGTQNQINTTLAALNGLTYLSAPLFNGTDTLTVTTDDQGHTGTPGALQTQNTLHHHRQPGEQCAGSHAERADHGELCRQFLAGRIARHRLGHRSRQSGQFCRRQLYGRDHERCTSR